MVSEKWCEIFFGKIIMQVHNPSKIWNQSSCKITGKNQSLVTLLTSLLIINFFTYRFSQHDWLWSEFQRPILMLSFFKYPMPRDITKLSGNKREPFSKKKWDVQCATQYSKICSAWKFTYPLQRHIRLKNFSSICCFAEELGITAAINPLIFML